MDPQVAKTPAAPSTANAKPPKKRFGGGLANREGIRLIGAGVLGVLITVFAVLNLDSVEVNWLLGSWSTPLIVVIVLSALIGMVLDRILVRRSSRRKRA
jgi:uncharacterized integral membrane protein